MMRIPIIVLFLVAAALLSETQISNAQSPYSYPWCAIYFGGGSGGSAGGAMSCYFASWGQCMTTMSGVGGLCVASPYFHGQATPLPRHSGVKLPHRRHTRT